MHSRLLLLDAPVLLVVFAGLRCTVSTVSTLRSPREPDRFVPTEDCSVDAQICSNLFGARSAFNASSICECQCPDQAPAFLPSTSICVAKLAECRRPIAFTSVDYFSRWLPVFVLPAEGNVFAADSPIFWKEAGVMANPAIDCRLESLSILSTRWLTRNVTSYFSLTPKNGSASLLRKVKRQFQWKGREKEASELEGALVQLKLSCASFEPNAHCIAFRVSGSRVEQRNEKFATVLGEYRRGNRAELIAVILLAILLILTVFGSVAVWSICWKYKKDRLIGKLQMQLIIHLQRAQQAQQAAYQLAAARREHDLEAGVTASAQSPLQVQIQPPPPFPQKRKLFFSAEFFDPQLMANPPELAEQFLYDLRKMIEIAKTRIRLKRHIPSLNAIAEEEQGGDNDLQEMAIACCMSSTESSPKSAKSTDSGRDSLDEEYEAYTKNWDTEEVQSEEKKSPSMTAQSRIPVLNTALPRYRQRTSMSDVDSESGTRSDCSKVLNGHKPLQESRSIDSSEAIDRILSPIDVAPPLPESVPPPIQRDRVRTRRRGYAVFPSFPSETLLKKSLPRRPRNRQTVSPQTAKETPL